MSSCCYSAESLSLLCYLAESRSSCCYSAESLPSYCYLHNLDFPVVMHLILDLLARSELVSCLELSTFF